MKVISGIASGLLVLALLPAPASAQGVRFTLAPSAEYVWWDDAVPLKDYTLIGARAGADFGRLLGVTAWYHRGDDIPVNFAESGLTASGAPFARTTTDVETFGTNLELKLGSGTIVPFVHGGAGVIRFTPADAPRIEQVNYRYGGGLQYDVARNIRATVLLEDSRFLLRPEALSAETPDVPSEDPRATRSNWTASASLGFALGGPRGEYDATQDRWSFASIPLEPFVGRLEFDDDNMPRQTVAGIRAGVDLGNYVGLRGVYWQGRTDGLAERMPIQGYGAEAQFNLNASLGVAPFLIAGAHRIDYQDDYRDALGLVREDENALVVGGGVGLRLTDKFRLNVAARDFIRSGREVDDIASIDELTHNWMLSAGIAFNIGRSRDRAKDGPRRDQEDPWTRNDRDDETPTPATRRMSPPVATDSARGRMIMLPVPESGELYVRYGATGGLMERLVRADSVPGHSTAGMSEADIQRVVALLSARIDSLLAYRMERMAPMAPRAASPAPARPLVQAPAAPPATPVIVMPTVVTPRVDMPTDTGRVIDGVAVYVAGFDALVLGVQLDAGPLFGLQQLRFVPEFAIGMSGDKSVLFAGGAEYRFGMLNVNETVRLRPHTRLSLGLLAASGDTDSQFGFNFAYGVTFEPKAGTTLDRKPRIFIEHQGIGFFEQNRLAGGLRWAF